MPKTHTRTYNVPCRMETLWATVDSDSPTQKKVWWKVKHKPEELKMAKSRKRRSPYVKICVHYVAWSWCQVCFHAFKRPDDKSFCFIPVPLMTRTVLYNFTNTYGITMHDQMTIVVTCWLLSRFLLHLQLALLFSSYFHSLSSLVMFTK